MQNMGLFLLCYAKSAESRWKPQYLKEACVVSLQPRGDLLFLDAWERCRYIYDVLRGRAISYCDISIYMILQRAKRICLTDAYA
jgi:hypothetical protein